jgi:hypothetical protein
MHIEKIYLQENYRRHPGDDPFLFGTVGVGVHINPDESIEDAIQLAKQQIKEFIANNTHYPEHNHVEVKDVQVQKTTPEQERVEELLADIRNCKTITELESYKLLVKNNPSLEFTYNLIWNNLTYNICTTSATPSSDAVH